MEKNIKEIIEYAKNKLIEAYDPLEIYLFGSYAWGNPTKDSDLDFFIVVEKSDLKKYKRSLAGYEALIRFEFPNDIIVYTKEEFDELSNLVETFCHKIKDKGEKIYARA
ncbi:MAG: nucleotidyltransferase domain-containing protein [bacterium]